MPTTLHQTNSLEIYRGAASNRRLGMSWTMDADRARWFVERYTQRVGARKDLRVQHDGRSEGGTVPVGRTGIGRHALAAVRSWLTRSAWARSRDTICRPHHATRRIR